MGSRINLTQCDEAGCFAVLDKNGLEGPAAFQLPANSDPTCYQIWARALGKPDGSATMKTCVDTVDGTFCSTDPEYILELSRGHGKQVFEDVTKQLTNIMNTELSSSPVPLFSIDGDWFWDYYNNGLRLAQLRFYEVTCPE